MKKNLSDIDEKWHALTECFTYIQTKTYPNFYINDAGEAKSSAFVCMFVV